MEPPTAGRNQLPGFGKSCERFEEIGLHALYNKVVVTDDHRGATEDVALWIADFPASVTINAAPTVEEVLAAPSLLIGLGR